MSDSQQRSVEQNYRDDEIDLFELWNRLVEEKKTILYSFLVAIFFAVVYLQISTPVYKSTAYLLSPLEKDIQEMNSLNLLTTGSSSSSSSSSSASAGSISTSGNIFTSNNVFHQFLVNLSSRWLKQAIFDKYDLKKVYVPGLEKLGGAEQKVALNKALEAFSKDFSVTLPKSGKVSDQEVAFSIVTKLEPEVVANMVNDAIETARRTTIDQIYDSIMSEYNVRVAQIDDKIESLRKTARDRRLDRIAKLNEAIAIAKVMKISEPKNWQSFAVNIGNVSAEQSMPMYFLGYKLLEAEKKSLETRKKDDPFITGLRTYQEQLAQLKALTVDKKAFGVVRIDQAAFPSDKPVKPKKTLVLAGAGVLGLILGVMIALVRKAYRNRKAQANV